MKDLGQLIKIKRKKMEFSEQCQRIANEILIKILKVLKMDPIPCFLGNYKVNIK